jgi:hypothetical protein
MNPAGDLSLLRVPKSPPNLTLAAVLPQMEGPIALAWGRPLARTGQPPALTLTDHLPPLPGQDPVSSTRGAW